jgi:hypothetical protein
MSNSTVVEWLNENTLRAYPLTEDSDRYFSRSGNRYDLFAIILDTLLMYASSAIPDTIKLNSIKTELVGGVATMTIQIDGQTPFTIDHYTTVNTEDHNSRYPRYARNSQHSVLAVGEEAARLVCGITVAFSNAVFEPSVSVELSDVTNGVSSLNISGNTLTGDITLTEGYQLSLIPGTENIAVEVGRNEGKPLPCVSVGADAGDCGCERVDECYDRCSDCCTVVSSINGAGPARTGNTINFLAGNHVKIYDDRDHHRIYIGLDFDTTDISKQIQINPRPLV